MKKVLLLLLVLLPVWLSLATAVFGGTREEVDLSQYSRKTLEGVLYNLGDTIRVKDKQIDVLVKFATQLGFQVDSLKAELKAREDKDHFAIGILLVCIPAAILLGYWLSFRLTRRKV